MRNVALPFISYPFYSFLCLHCAKKIYAPENVISFYLKPNRHIKDYI